MKIKVFANFEEENAVITEKEYQERLDKAIDEMAKDCIAFDEWLNNYYFAAEIWDATPEKREKILEKWKEHCQDCVEDDGDMMWWKEFELEV